MYFQTLRCYQIFPPFEKAKVSKVGTSKQYIVSKLTLFGYIVRRGGPFVQNSHFSNVLSSIGGLDLNGKLLIDANLLVYLAVSLGISIQTRVQLILAAEIGQRNFWR